MSRKSLTLGAALALVACNNAGNNPFNFTPGERVSSVQVLPTPDTMDLNSENYLGTVEANAGSSAESRDEWNSTRERTGDAFGDELEGFPEFAVLNGILEAAADIDLTVGEDGILRFEDNITLNFFGNSLTFLLELEIFPNQALGQIETTISLDGTKRIFMTHDLQITEVDTVIFDAEEAPRAEVTFRRDQQDFGLRFLNLNNNNEIVVTADRNGLFLERDKDSDGFGNSNFEVQVLVETNQFFGKALATVPFLGTLDFCFGNRRLEDANCNEIEEVLPGTPGFPE